MPFQFHDLPDLVKAFRGFQGPDPEDVPNIFLSSDANFPCAADFQVAGRKELLQRTLLFLRGSEEWKAGAVLRESSCPELRDLEPALAHHPALLKDWNWRWSGAQYHQRVARLFYRVRANGGPANIADLCSFVELICRPTTGNIGDRRLPLLRGEEPPGETWASLNVPSGFSAAQEDHSGCFIGPLIDPLRSPQKRVFMPRSICRDIARAPVTGHLGLIDGEGLRSVEAWFKANPGRRIFNGAVDRVSNRVPSNWVITRSFPYFRGKGIDGDTINHELEQIAQAMVA
jgi:hypothetical protein